MNSAEYYASKEQWLMDVTGARLPTLTVSCAILLAHYINRPDALATGLLCCWPSQIRLADETSSTEDGVLKAINKLEKAGFVRVERRRGRANTNRYYLITGTIRPRKPRQT